MAERRSHHWTDVPIVGQNRRRQIKNWANHRKGSNPVWQETNVDPKASTGTPDDWEGNYDFGIDSQDAPVQCFVKDTSDASNRALWGMRLSERPGIWVNWKAQNPDNVVAEELQRVNKLVRFVNLWNGINLVLVFKPNGLTTRLVLKGNPANHPAQVRFSMRIPPRMSYQFSNGVIQFFDGMGNPVMQTRAPAGRDSTGDGDVDALPVQVTMNELAPTPQGFPVFQYVFNQTDLAAATYPVRIE